MEIFQEKHLNKNLCKNLILNDISIKTENVNGWFISGSHRKIRKDDGKSRNEKNEVMELINKSNEQQDRVTWWSIDHRNTHIHIIYITYITHIKCIHKHTHCT